MLIGFTEGDVGSVCAEVQDMGSLTDIQREITVTFTTLDLTTGLFRYWESYYAFR